MTADGPSQTRAVSQVRTAPRSELATGDILRMAAWFGLTAGLLEACAVPVRRAIAATGVAADAHTWWLIPAGDLVWFTAGGLVLAGMARLAPRLVTPRLAVFCLAFVGLTSVLFLFHPHVSHKASLLLAGGVAFQLSRVLARRHEGFRRHVRRSLPWMLAAVALFAAGVFGVRAAAERILLSRLPAPATGAPNVLLIVLDTVRAPSVTFHGYGRETTPNLARFAKSGVVFERAVAPAPWTLPTHASLFTGRPPRDLGVGFAEPLGDGFATLAEFHAERGYATAGFAANRDYCSRGSGLERGFAHYDDFGVGWGTLLRGPALIQTAAAHFSIGYADFQPPGRAIAAEVSRAFLEWVGESRDRPFFAFLNYFDAHVPYLPPPPFNTLFTDNPPADMRINVQRGFYDRAGVEGLRSQYDGAIAYLDRDVSDLLEQLRARGLLDDTLVVITSDHGEEFAEHEVLQHTASLYMPALHVPLVISWPRRVPADTRVETPVSLQHVGATILDLVFPDDRPAFPGASLARHFRAGGGPAGSDDAGADPILSEVEPEPGALSWWPVGAGPLRSIVSRGHHYIRSDGARPEELYDWFEDPWEQRNLAGLPEHAETLARCRLELERMAR